MRFISPGKIGSQWRMLDTLYHGPEQQLSEFACCQLQCWINTRPGYLLKIPQKHAWFICSAIVYISFFWILTLIADCWWWAVHVWIICSIRSLCNMITENESNMVLYFIGVWKCYFYPRYIVQLALKSTIGDIFHLISHRTEMLKNLSPRLSELCNKDINHLKRMIQC